MTTGGVLGQPPFPQLTLASPLFIPEGLYISLRPRTPSWLYGIGANLNIPAQLHDVLTHGLTHQDKWP